MESTRELNFEELTLLLDLFAREYAATGNAHRRREIAIEISELTARISAVRSRPPPDPYRSLSGRHRSAETYLRDATAPLDHTLQRVRGLSFVFPGLGLFETTFQSLIEIDDLPARSGTVMMP